eukprot:snap_masked-scaffold_1-processed-gene-26.32-mRNA-1 protein AED:1.00 eAED:1.00 QI:0/-1/0/0/-1/1/1/0/67
MKHLVRISATEKWDLEHLIQSPEMFGLLLNGKMGRDNSLCKSFIRGSYSNFISTREVLHQAPSVHGG